MIVPNGNSGKRISGVIWSGVNRSVGVGVRLVRLGFNWLVVLSLPPLLTWVLVSLIDSPVSLMLFPLLGREICRHGIVAEDAAGAFARAAHPSPLIANRPGRARFSTALPSTPAPHRRSHAVDRDLMNQFYEAAGGLDLLYLAVSQL